MLSCTQQAAMSDLTKADQKYWTGSAQEFSPPGSNPQTRAEGSLGTNTPLPCLCSGMSWGYVFYTVFQDYTVTGLSPSGCDLAITTLLASFPSLSHCHSPARRCASCTPRRNFLRLNGCHKICFWGTQTKTRGPFQSRH